MDFDDLQIKEQLPSPPLMPWRSFADWIGMGGSHDIVWGWIRNGYIPSHKLGKHVMVNVALFTHQLMEKEEF
ncbi:DNA-binding protein [Pseudomonas aeruginosa]|uniref:DNA-binding protein n=1 Tax=Pseudomonas aeruginosa TaxID=287 RepID=UPI000F8374A9|nr:DNA-binding protein [Pseudomonas aeruginosa]RTS19942.1 DNA-binding protein [Pseudomonas aeruginosa]TEG23326.1 DNA-binding protein [Pseudomonas aeruginosa]TEG49365.1 DNA-binding protein [Pseudomonas aeruginosa]HBN8442189.1 DNA-binding protein [Pseudomonas aeruginosa]HCA6674992.1 DNA-binding protein [Pseudomonas aeruginosa]